MPMLDVSVALTNPYTLDSFNVHRRKQTINEFGETTISDKVFAGVAGIVHPEGGNDLARRPEAQIQTKSLTVYTRFGLRSESEDCEDNSQYQPDLIEWRGDFFLVIHVEDWSQFARGYVKVTATSIDMVDQPPTPKALTTINDKVDP
ncbi:MAG TPA: hypothetical protein VND65_18190 [Candidatus Binatia bacterium]|nr:hypothetical protein [Candidatus Binatia bacterium]